MSRFSVEFFCLRVPKNFVGELFCAVLKKISGSEKEHDFPWKIFCLTVPKKFVGEPFKVSLISGFEKCLGQIVKVLGTTVARTPNLLLENLVALSLPLSFIFE